VTEPGLLLNGVIQIEEFKKVERELRRLHTLNFKNRLSKKHYLKLG